MMSSQADRKNRGSGRATSVFARFNGYCFVHHRALNAHESRENALKVIAGHPSRDHALEGDLCWDFRAGAKLFYFRHPSRVVDTLSSRSIRRALSDGTLVTLDDLTSLKNGKGYLVLELKVGRGDAKAALSWLIDYLEGHFPGRYWIDGFSLSLLEQVKRICPRTTVTLHTELVYRGRALIGAPEWPPVRVKKLSDLPAIDGVAVRWRGGEARMARACADVHAANKALVVSRIYNLRKFERSKAWGACAGYVPWSEDVLALDDRLAASTRSNADRNFPTAPIAPLPWAPEEQHDHL